jgi:hypothetical protein
MRRPGLAITILVSIVLFSASALAQVAPDDLVITGAGWGNGWDTEIELADSELGVGTSGSIFTVTGLAGPCPPICESVPYTIPPKGSVRILVSEAFPFIQALMTVRVTTDTEQPLPIVRARVFNGAVPGQSAEIPVFRNPTTSPRTLPVLVFSGLRRQPGVYSNLVLQSFGTFGGDVLVEVLGPDGQQLGSEVIGMPKIETLPIVLLDVAGRFGLAEVDGGQVRVTSQSGRGLWGVLATVYVGSRLDVVEGANP